MAEISDLEQRLAEALARMRRAHAATRQAFNAAQHRIAELEAAPPPAALEVSQDALAQAEAEIARLSAALEAEREQGASIARQAEADRAALAEARSEIEALRAAARLEKIQTGEDGEGASARLTALEQGIDQLRAVNAQLRQNNAALRKAHEAGMADPDLVNGALQLEIDALLAARAADRAEIDSILAALKPLVEETEDA
jgi:DNA repair exonuclease SbcCD ATPase subunit